MFETGQKVFIKNDPLHNKYIISEINGSQYTLTGYSYRIIRTATEEELESSDNKQIEDEDQKNERYRNKVTSLPRGLGKNKIIFGRILHIDGDEEYLRRCMDLYKDLGIPAEGIYIKENMIASQIGRLMDALTPDIVVITGHDGYNKKGLQDLNNYENSLNFSKAIRVIRQKFNCNEVVVIAGACGSHFEALIGSGANFASSPKRVNTHTYDPAIVAIKVASTSYNRLIEFNDIVKYIENGRDAIGGIESNGKMRLIL
jgi:spore coat assembly protein